MALVKTLAPVQTLSLIIFIRILSVFLVETWYVPDEYWQTLEVAHKHTFGYGALTWEWQKGIRSYLYPSIVTVLYYILKITNLDYPEALILLPRILQAIISAVADYSIYKWSGYRKWALFLMMTSWFWFYTASRTLLQTLETSLVAIALSLFPFKEGKLAYYQKEDNRWVWLACVSVFVRPTSAPLWIVLGLYNLVTTNQGRVKLLLQTFLPIGLLAGGALVALDSYFYGKLIITPWEFFKLNVLQDIASFYGKHPWYWYITHGLPAILGIDILPVVWGIAKILRRPKENKIGALLLTAVALHLAVHSYIPHKEFRFVMPLLPILLYIAQDVIVQWSRKAKKWQLYTVAFALVFGNAIPTAYFGVIHQRGTIDVMPVLRENILNNKTSILFAMPCHSTPLYSHIHANVSIRYLSCDPPPPGETYEAEAFFNNPGRWWARELAIRQPPTLVVLFDVLRGRLDALRDYRLIRELPHTQFPEGEVSEKVLVYQRKEARPKVQTDDVV